MLKWLLALAFCSIQCSSILKSQNITAIDSLFSTLEERKLFNGNVIIMKGDEILLEKSMGFSDVRGEQPLTKNSVLELASLGKLITALAIGKLKDQSQLNFDDPVSEYIIEFPFEDVTLRHLLNHTASLPDYLSYFSNYGKAGIRYYNQDVLDFIINTDFSPEFSPGSKFKYSNTGYVVLASIVEKVSGYPFDGFVEKFILKSNNIAKLIPYSFKYHDLATIKNYAYGYRLNDNDSLYAVNTDMKTRDPYQYGIRPICGDGNYVGTVRAYAKLVRKFIDGSVLSKSTKAAFFRDPEVEHENKGPYGFGLFLDRAGNGCSHTGSVPGYQAYFRYIESNDTLIVYVRNIESWDWSWFELLNDLLEK